MNRPPRRSLARAAPTWSPQTAQEKWWAGRARGNFNQVWGASSLHAGNAGNAFARVMPKPYGARWEEREGLRRRVMHATPAPLRSRLPRVSSTCRIELGPPWRDPRGSRTSSGCLSLPALRGAFATGGSTVTRRAPAMANVTRERQPSETELRSTTLELGARVLARSAHEGRATAPAVAHNHCRASCRPAMHS